MTPRRFIMCMTLSMTLFIASLAFASDDKASVKSFLPVSVGNWWLYVSDTGEQEMWVITSDGDPVIMTRYLDEEPILAWALRLYDNRIDLMERKVDSGAVQYQPSISVLMAGNHRQQWGYYYAFNHKHLVSTGPMTTTFEYVAVETIDVQAGTFSTQHVVWSIESGDTIEMHEAWFCENVGLVRERVTISESGSDVETTVEWELVSYGVR